MSHKTNDEKLRILQERLAHIKQKEEAKQNRQKIHFDSSKNNEPIEVTTNQKSLMSKSLKYSVIFGSLICITIYIYNKINFNSVISEKDTIKIEKLEKPLEYYIKFEGQNNIAIVGSFEDENTAKALVNNLKVKGFKTDYFFLPDKSNSMKEIFKVFIGPYENTEEANQWLRNLDVDFEIIQLSK